VVHGKTDEIGFYAVENPRFRDRHPRHRAPSARARSREARDPGRRRLEIDRGQVIHEILS
jgi:hypothetical protein